MKARWRKGAKVLEKKGRRVMGERKRGEEKEVFEVKKEVDEKRRGK